MTPTELCNVALGHIGQARIADIGERSPGAEHCRRMFDHVRRLCLRDHDWNFAVRRAALTALETAPPFGFSAAYQLPADCLRVLAINGQPAGVRGTQWEVEGRTVLINADVAHLRYIADADDVTQWDSIFASYFGYRLAAAVAPSFRIDPQAGLQLEQMAAAVRASAQEADNVETAPRVTRLDQSEIIQERGSRWPSGTAGTGTGNAGGSSIGWSRIAVTGQPTVAATVAGDTFTLVAGTNVTITTDATAKTVTISATGGGGAGVTDGSKGDIAVSGTGTVWTIAANAVTTAKIADGAVTVAKTTGFGTMAIQAANNVTITGGAITGTTVSGITLANGGSGALTVTGTASIAGASSGTNTGDQTITLTGDVTGSGTGSFAATLANSGVTAGTYTRASITVDAKGRVTAATSGSGGEISGTSGTTDNGIVRADGTSGSAVQGSSIAIDDIDTATQQNVAIRNVDPATNSAVVITPKGNGAFIVGPKPDGTTTGGNARGARAVDLQSSRGLNSQVASNTDTFVCGANNTASGTRAGVFSGESNTASASRAACLAGNSNTSSAAEGVTIGGSGAIANRIGMQVNANGAFSNNGDAQAGRVVMRRQTTDATPLQLSINGSAPTGSAITTSTHFILLNNQAVFADIRVVARSTSGTDHAAYIRRVLIKRDANAASTAIVGTVLSPTADIESAGATTWDVGVTADTTNGGMLITVTGAALTTINWTAEVSFVETIRA